MIPGVLMHTDFDRDKWQSFMRAEERRRQRAFLDRSLLATYGIDPIQLSVIRLLKVRIRQLEGRRG